MLYLVQLMLINPCYSIHWCKLKKTHIKMQSQVPIQPQTVFDTAAVQKSIHTRFSCKFRVSVAHPVLVEIGTTECYPRDKLMIIVLVILDFLPSLYWTSIILWFTCEQCMLSSTFKHTAHFCCPPLFSKYRVFHHIPQ